MRITRGFSHQNARPRRLTRGRAAAVLAVAVAGSLPAAAEGPSGRLYFYDRAAGGSAFTKETVAGTGSTDG
jgi:hypothetical protein